VVFAYPTLRSPFFFGSPHPCGILEARQRPYLIERARADPREDRRLALDLIKSMQPEAMDAGISMLETLKRPTAQRANRPKAQDRVNDSRRVRLAGNHVESTQGGRTGIDYPVRI
jgi:hypothetical protein